MAKAETGVARAPRGTRPVSQAFFTALDAVPEAQRAAVAKAAQVAIRDELKARREKSKATAAKAKAQPRTPASKASAPGKPPRRTGTAKPVRGRKTTLRSSAAE
jgi:hypothetical protein